MNFLKKVSSLQEKSSVQLAINLCQDNCFKEVSLCLELVQFKATTQHKVPKRFKPIYREKEYTYDDYKIQKWDTAVREQCQKLTEGLNRFLRQEVHSWMIRIALQYLSFGRRLEEVFGVPRYFWIDSLTRDDWTEVCRLDERKIAKRLLKDERLTASQRYRIACVYCLLENISELREKLTKYEKASINKKMCYRSSDRLVRIWTLDWNGNERIMQQDLLTNVMKQLVDYGNLATVMSLWKKLEKPVQKELVMDLALSVLRNWLCTKQDSIVYKNLRKKSLLNDLNFRRLSNYFNLPSYYCELVYFFLSEMHEEHHLEFFEKSFGTSEYILECFLDWPLQGYFLSTINRLWDKVPMKKYIRCLLTLVCKYSGDYSSYRENFSCLSRQTLPYAEQNCNYDYRTLLEKLWEETPEEYKQLIFADEKLQSNDGSLMLFSSLVKRSPFQERDERLFKRIWHYLDKKTKFQLMYSEYGLYMCSIIIQKENWSFLNWLLEDGLAEKYRSAYKKLFVFSRYGAEVCFYNSYDNHENFLEELFNWAFNSDSEKKISKDKFINGTECFDAIKYLLCRGRFTRVDRVINFCIVSQEMKNRLKVHLVYRICSILLESCQWKQMDDMLSWCFKTKKEIGGFKKDLFSSEGLQTHFSLLFKKQQMENVEEFYEFFCLSPTKIKNIKEETLFTADCMHFVKDWLYTASSQKIPLAPLNWCLSSEKIAIDFVKKIEECFKLDVEEGRFKKKRLENLVYRIISGFKTDVEGDKTKQNNSVRKKGGKRSEEVVDESKPPKKRFKRSV